MTIILKELQHPLYAQNPLELIGNTPMVGIRNLTGPNDATVLAKLEGHNIGGSVKDRIALAMIEDAERRGILTKDKIILEPTSGNTGIGLALVAAVKGYKTIFIMPDTVSEERRHWMKAFGAEFILTNGKEEPKGTAGAIKLGYQMAKENPRLYFLPDQFNNPTNPQIHYETTGKEILEQTGGKIDMFIAGIGTGGTIMGVGKRLREYNPNIKIVAVEPAEGQSIQGLRNMKEPFPPSIFKESFVDEKINIGLEEAKEMANLLAKKEQLFVGISSGAAMHVALVKARELGRGKTIVTVFPDGGAKYLSNGVFK
jgi:cysteine synthase